MTITINNYAYKIPESWLDITIKQLQDINEIQNSGITGFESEVILTSILTQIPEDILNEIPYTDYLKIQNALSFINREFPQEMTPVFTHMGIDYEIDINIANITTAEFIDMDMLQKEGILQLHMMMAILYKPKTETPNKYNIKDLKLRAEIFKEFMPAQYALTAMAFMVVLGQTLIINSPAYSLILTEMEKTPIFGEMTQTIKTCFQNTMDGKSPSMSLPETI